MSKENKEKSVSEKITGLTKREIITVLGVGVVGVCLFPKLVALGLLSGAGYLLVKALDEKK